MKNYIEKLVNEAVKNPLRDERKAAVLYTYQTIRPKFKHISIKHTDIEIMFFVLGKGGLPAISFKTDFKDLKMKYSMETITDKKTLKKFLEILKEADKNWDLILKTLKDYG